jgi:starch synthase
VEDSLTQVDRPLKILVLAAECTPFVKTGGLADVIGDLPKAVKAMGHDIRVAIPRYGRIDREKFALKETVGPFPVPMNSQAERASILQTTMSGDVPVYMVENAKYYDRDGIYMYPDDAERFVFFCRAALEMLKRLEWAPDIIHCHDWHTGIVPNLLKTIYADDPFFAETAIVYTFHSLTYQGIFGYRVLEIAGIDEYGFIYHPEMADLSEVVDLMGRGIYFADMISTVSETYAREVLTPEYGERLDPILRERQDRLVGILNGIDYDVMNPATDPYLAANYDAEHLDKRPQNKLALQREAGLRQDPDVPLIGMVSRLSDQKGLDILSKVLEPLLQLDLQFVLLGTGDQHYHDLFTKAARSFPGKAAVFLTFNAALTQKIHAGADIYLMPSRVEPCGTSQMVAMHYGGIPIVRATGGLADTVHEFDPRSDSGNGFVFEPYEPWALFAAIVRAMESSKYVDSWRALQRRNMQLDFSWGASARKYVKLYQRAMSIRTANGQASVKELNALP